MEIVYALLTFIAGIFLYTKFSDKNPPRNLENEKKDKELASKQEANSVKLDGLNKELEENKTNNQNLSVDKIEDFWNNKKK